MADIEVLGHNYQTGATQILCDTVEGTSGIIREAPKYAGKRVLFCGVLYMAEDLYVMADGKADVYIPEILVRNGEILSPRCPMIVYQDETSIVRYEHIAQARAMKPDMVLVYINTPISMKAASDGVYNGTSALAAIEKIASKRKGKGRIVFIGDYNVNNWIRKKIEGRYPEFEIISSPGDDIFCPTHVRINDDDFIGVHQSFIEKFGAENTGLTMHAEVSPKLLQYGFDNSAYFGGTDGIVKNVVNSTKPYHVVGTVEGAVEQIRRKCSHTVYSPGVVCGNMAYTAPRKVERAKEILSKGGPAAEITFAHEKAPYYDIKILRPELVKELNADGMRSQVIPAVRLKVDKRFIVPAKKTLSMLLA